MKSYLVVIERSQTGYSAFVPDLPGCIGTDPARSAVEANMREAIKFHMEAFDVAA